MKSGRMAFIAALAYFVLILSRMSYAIPVPLGVEGIIYELDGVTQVKSGIDFYVKNEQTGKTLYGKTGHGSSGRYSVSISGNIGDFITVSAWNKFNQANGTLILNGVMKSANLYLNMTYPPISPNITSYPETAATEDQIYIYQIEAFDENDDLLQYFLNSGPKEMEIEGNLLTWIPKNEDVGMHNASISVSDGIFIANQSFEINVLNSNDEVIINSSPVTKVKIGEQYSYSVIAFDIDKDILNYSLVIFPQGMTISESGVISWKPNGRDKGENKVVVGVSDGTSLIHQEFTVNVLASENQEEPNSPAPRSSGGGGGGGGGAPNLASKQMDGERKSIVAVKLPVNGAEIRIEGLSSRPRDAKRLERKVYRYLIIENVKEIKINNTEGAEINFTVDAKWLSENQISPSEIILTRYHNNTWQDLTTLNVSNDQESIHYVAKTPGFSYFAISVREGTFTANGINPKVSKIEAPFRFTGIVHNFLMLSQAKPGTKIFFENTNTGKRFVAETAEPNSGAYYIFVEGNANDQIKMTIEGTKKEFTTGLRDAQISFMLSAAKTSFVAYEGNPYFAIMKDSTVILAFCALLAIAAGCTFYRFHKN